MVSKRSHTRSIPIEFRGLWRLALAVIAMLLPLTAGAGTGVSEDRVSLPEGPGSLEGVGENVEIDPNMGQMRYAVRIQVPQGHSGMTPGVSLSYSSGGGGSVVGMGWSLSMPNIERMTARGLPEYDRDDEFAVNGGEQLVLIPATDPPVYRSRFESGFVRYTWRDAGTGDEGYWTAEMPDGRISYYGADAAGTLVPEARVAGTAGTFRYHLVETVDRYGHKLAYTYALFGNVTLPVHIGWVFDGDTPAYEVTFQYEDREEFLSDCKPGFNELLTKRLQRVNVLSRQTRLRNYDLTYEDYATSGGFTRLVGVQLFGKDGTAYPTHETFTYNAGLGVDCQGADCVKPYTVEMGSLGVSLLAGDTTLIDINGDALPDVIDTSQDGQPHRFFINRLYDDGQHEFLAPIQSTLGSQGGHDMSSPYTQVMDVDGDGRTDMINSATGQVLHNLGTGDWTETFNLWDSGDGGVPDLDGDFDPSDGELRTVRFIDYDNDKRIDLIRSQGADVANVTTVYRNLGNGGFQSDDTVEPIEAGFETDSLELNDMNGDGMSDAVQVLPSQVRYKLNLGWGRWSDWVVIGGFNFTDQEAIQAELEDINGDALADLVLVAGDQVRYWLNRNSDDFDAEQTVATADIDGEIPVRTSETVVLYADMNGNGSSDIVWIDMSGKTTYLELFPERPNLMNRVENGLGKVTEVTYGSSVEHMARDGGPGSWPYALPHPMAVVNLYDEWNELTDVHETAEYTYHDGFYDGEEKQFRGYERVETLEPGDATGEEGYASETYDVGAEDPYHNGLLITRELQGAGGRSIQYQENEYADCDVDDVPDTGLLFDVRYVCKIRELNEEREGLPASEWVTTETRTEYDGYGNVVLDSNLGVTAIGGGACPACDGSGYFGAPCGPQCLGDESYTRTEYAVPADNADRWILRSVTSEKSFGEADAQGQPATEVYTESTAYYDGDAFVGLPLGQVTHGTAVRETVRASTAGDLIETARNKLDAHGNVIETIGPLGTIGGNTHRRMWTMDDDGLRVIKSEILLENGDGPYSLQRAYVYEPLLNVPVEASQWMRAVGGTPENARNSTFWAYDEFGRMISTTYHGETAGMVSENYTWELGNPVSRVILSGRTTVGGPLDHESVTCFDGHGRAFQERTKVADGAYIVSGFTVFNTKGEEQEVFQAYEGTTGDCDLAAPAGTPSVKSEFDALGRITRQVMPDANPGDGEDEVTRTEYRPLTRVTYDLEDTYTQGPFSNTPTITRTNGLGSVVAHEQVLTDGGTPIVHQYRYDALGNFAGWVDPDGNERVQEYDLLGRVIRVDDPDRGEMLFAYDAADNQIRSEDARGKVRHFIWDGTNRKLAEWDDADPTGSRIEYTYDVPGDCPVDQCTNVAGRLARVSYPLDAGGSGEDRHGFDVRGEKTYISRLLDGHLFELRTEYDNIGRAINTTYPSGLKVDYELDGDGRPVKIPGYIDDIQYEDRGDLAEMALANGVNITYAYDERLRLATINALGPGGAVVLDYTYTRDREDNIVAVADGRADDGEPMGGAQYEYDALYRLLEARLDPDRATQSETMTYAHDSIGNMITKSSSLGAASKAHIGTLVYGENGAGPHAVTTAGTLTLDYDAAGQLMARGDDSYDWDYMGRMNHAVNGAGELADFVYGSATERLIKREDGRTAYFAAPDFEVRDGVATTYIKVGDGRVVKIEEPGFADSVLSDVAPASGADNAITAEPDTAITAGDAWIAQAVGAGVLAFATPTEVSSVNVLIQASLRRLLLGSDTKVSYLHHDHLGGTVAVTDGQGQVTERMEYYPFGLSRYKSGDGEDYEFTGKETDKTTGLTYFGARYLDPWTGRWISPDPAFHIANEDDLEDIGEATFAHVFSRNNPINFPDEDGREPTPKPATKSNAIKQLAPMSKITITSIKGVLKTPTYKGSLKPDAAKQLVNNLMGDIKNGMLGKKSGEFGSVVAPMITELQGTTSIELSVTGSPGKIAETSIKSAIETSKADGPASKNLAKTNKEGKASKNTKADKKSKTKKKSGLKKKKGKPNKERAEKGRKKIKNKERAEKKKKAAKKNKAAKKSKKAAKQRTAEQKAGKTAKTAEAKAGK